jgi:5,10-methylenetetrahydrofolate reductase
VAESTNQPVNYRFRSMLDQGDWIVSVEVDPPKAMDLDKGMRIVERLRDAGVDCIDAGDSPMASVRMNPALFCVAMQQRTGVESIIHFTSRDRNLMALQADLMGAHAMGIRTLIALSGDPPSLGQYGAGKYGAASAVWDVRADGLIEIATDLNAGIDSAGSEVGAATDFTIVTSANPGAEDLEAEITKMQVRAEKGAHVFFTQNCFDVGLTERFLEQAQRVGRPVVLGVMPLASERNARFMATQVPGVTIPAEILQRMEAAGDDALEAGMDIAREYISAVRDSCAGVYLVPALGRYASVTQLVRELKAGA